MQPRDIEQGSERDFEEDRADCRRWNALCPEPPVRIELTTARLQGECSTTELRRPVLTGDSLTAHSSSGPERSWSITRWERTVRGGGRRDGRRPGNGIRSAMLLSGLTTKV